jgi:hypothetical protein
MPNDRQKLRSPKPPEAPAPGTAWREYYKREGEWVPVPIRSVTVEEYLSKTSKEATRWQLVPLQKAKKTVTDS